MKNLLLIFCFCGFTACSGAGSSGGNNPGNTEFATTPVQGLMNGAPWVFLSGTAKVLSNENTFRISLNDEDIADPCNSFQLGKRSLLTRTPAVLGETVFGVGPVMQTVTFSFLDNGTYQNLAATQGRIAITEITSEEVFGSIVAKFDDANVVNGTFKIKLCPQQ